MRGIITVVGKDTVGIIAKVCTYLAQNNIVPMYLYTIVFLLLMFDHAVSCVKLMRQNALE